MRIPVRCLALLAVILQISAVELPQDFENEDIINCVKELKLEVGDKYKVMDENFQIVDSPSTRSLAKCFFTRAGLCKDGDFVREAITDYNTKRSVPFYKPEAQNPREVAEMAFDACVNVTGGEIGEKVVNLLKCMITEFKKK